MIAAVRYAFLKILTLFVILVPLVSGEWLTASEGAYVEELFTDCTFDCTDVIANCERLIPELYARGSFDTVQALLSYWKQHCWFGYGSPQERLSIVLGMARGVGAVREPCELFHHVRCYQGSLEYRGPHGATLSLSQRDPIDSLAAQIAHELIITGKVSALDSVLCVALAGHPDSFFIAMRSQRYQHTAMKRCYDSVVRAELNQYESYLGAFVGLWSPTSRRRQLGTHPVLGIFMGLRQNRFLAEAFMSFGFLNTPRPFTVERKGVLVSTQDFQLFALGLDLGFQVARVGRHEFDAIVGGGVQSLQTAHSDADDWIEQIMSLQGSLGLAYRFYVGRYAGAHVAVEPRYEVSKIETGGTDLSGSAFVIRLVYAWGEERSALRSLHY